MRKRFKRVMRTVALAAGALSAAAALLVRKRKLHKSRAQSEEAHDVWARPGMSVTFRAEVMPGRDREERTFRVEKLLPSGRVLLQGVAGEHAEREFEPAR